MANNTFLATKPHYEILDGLRGVAAIMVVIFHVVEFFAPHGVQHAVNHGYLAVDFFFMLSGFVIGYAYDDRWGKMSLGSFFKRRLVRLHPMVVLGTIIGFCMFFLVSDSYPKVFESSPELILLCFVMALFMIPTTPGIDARGWAEMNIFVDTSWSLTYEYVANILYALFLRHLPKMVIAFLCVVSVIPLLDMTLGWNLFGLFPEPQYHIKGGWSITPDQIYVGFTRLSFPFLCGLLISRILPERITPENPTGSPIRIRGGFWWATLLLVTILCVPCIGGEDGVANGLYQVVCIVLLFPLIILMGAGSKTTGSGSMGLCKFLGDLSYPLYITHFQLIFLQMAFVHNHPDAELWQKWFVGGGIVVVSILIGYAMLKTYDEPVRHWLTERWLKRK
ncbi:MAG: acyltransferase [Prevotellamassilia sp.]|nr:acyltransferase [Prevotellamassilia sp.]